MLYKIGKPEPKPKGTKVRCMISLVICKFLDLNKYIPIKLIFFEIREKAELGYSGVKLSELNAFDVIVWLLN